MNPQNWEFHPNLQKIDATNINKTKISYYI